MADEPRARRWPVWVSAAGLAAVIAVAGGVGFALSNHQRPPTAPPSTPTSGLPTLPPVTPTPVPRGPVSTFGFAVSDDPAAHEVVLFGGVDSYDQTWVWDGATWSLMKPGISPPGRFNAAAAYDPLAGVVMLFGGRLQDGDLTADTWAWNGQTWRELDTGTGAPAGGEGAAMAWDAAADRMLLVAGSRSGSGGDTFVWNGARWIATGSSLPGTSIAGEMAFDPISRSLLLVSPLLPPAGDGPSTWRWSGHTWVQLDAVPPIATTGLTLDPSSGGLMVCSDPTSQSLSQLWRWDGGGWRQVPGSALAIELDVEVTDLSAGQLLMLGFGTPTSTVAPQPVQVWSWTGRAWKQLA